MEQLLNKGASISSLAFLRILKLVHGEVTKLVEDLKEYELAAAVPRSPTDSNEMRRSLSGMGTSPAPTNLATISLGSMLETAMEELFVPYTEGLRYLERESKSLSELYSDHLLRFTRYHVRH